MRPISGNRMQTTRMVTSRDMTTSLRSDPFRAALAVAALLAASGTNFLRYHDYPLLSPEVGWFAVFLGMMALGMSALYVVQNRYWRAFVETAIVFLAVDLNTDSPIATAIAASAALIYLILRGGTLLPLITIMFGVAFLTSLIGLGETRAFLERKEQPSSVAATALPAVVHLILDEHIGVEGLPANNAEAVRVRDDLKASYMSHGFKVYGGAYSEHLHTVNAIPHILNFGDRPEGTIAQDDGVILGKTRYFEAMKSQGYKINILQSDFAEYCSSASYESCTTYWPHSLKLLRHHRFTPQERAYLMAFKFLSLSRGIGNLAAILDYAATVSFGPTFPRLDIDLRSRTSSVGALAAFDLLNSRLVRAQPGEVYFMHVLAPHYPYVASADCSLRRPSAWEGRLSTTAQQIRENAYLEQVGCVTAKVNAAVSALSLSSAKDNFVMIVHGDHGSRITKMDPTFGNLGKFDDADMVAGFSTLFALKGPGVEPGYSSERAPVHDLLRQFVEGAFQTPPVAGGNSAPDVYLDDWDWKPRERHPLPQHWSNAVTAQRTE